MRQIESFVVYVGLFNLIFQFGGLVPAAVAVVVVAHLAIERPRYQFIFAYALLGYMMYWDFQTMLSGDDFFRPYWFIVVGAAILIISSAGACLVPVIKFSTPEGDHKWVGCTSAHLKGTSDKKRLSFMTRIFYPAETIRGYRESYYMPNGTLTTSAYARFVDQYTFIFSHLALAKSDCFIDAPLVKNEPKLPVAIYCHGLGANADYALTIVRYLVSHGYFVVCIEHNDKSACVTKLADGSVTEYKKLPKGAKDNVEHEFAFRNSQLNIRTKEARFTLDTLHEWNQNAAKSQIPVEITDRLDLDRVVVMGHSFGGATAVQACLEDDRFRACVNHDGWQLPIPKQTLAAGLQTCPLLLIQSEQFLNWEPNFKSMMKMFENSGDDSVYLTLKGTRHQNFCDIAVWASYLMKRVRATGPINPKRALRLINNYNMAFLRKYNAPKEDEVKEEPLLSGEINKMPDEVMCHHR